MNSDGILTEEDPVQSISTYALGGCIGLGAIIGNKIAYMSHYDPWKKYDALQNLSSFLRKYSNTNDDIKIALIHTGEWEKVGEKYEMKIDDSEFGEIYQNIIKRDYPNAQITIHLNSQEQIEVFGNRINYQGTMQIKRNEQNSYEIYCEGVKQ